MFHLDYKHLLSSLLSPFAQLPESEILSFIESPPDPAMGHFAFPCFRLAKTLKKAPPVIALEIAAQTMDKPLPEWLGKVVATGPYVNFFLDTAAFARETLEAIRQAGDRYGASDEGAGRKVLVEYSSPNIAKHFNPGHFANTMIGKALDNIFRYLGYSVTSINHLGDFGTQFGKLITAYQLWGSREEIERTEIDGLLKIYVRFHEEAEKNPSLNDTARAWVVRMQDGDEEALELWRWFVDISMRSFNRLYDRLGVRFDLIRGESYYTDKMTAVVETIRQKGLLVESDGAQIVDLEDYGMPPCLILRSDGGTLYPTRDIAAAIDRYETFKFDKSIYVTATEQILHFAQWIKVVELMGFPWAKDITHVTYGMYLFESGRMSTRKGDVLNVEDLLNEAVAKTRAIIEEKNPNLADKEAVAEQVGVGALIFNRLYNGRIKDTMFNLQQMLSFEGETGPYVQYTHARTCSVLGKAKPSDIPDAAPQYSLISDPESFDVIRLLHDYPSVIKDAADKYEPFLISRHLVALAQAFNAFYQKNVILTDDAQVKHARLTLTKAVQTVLRGGLALLGISAPCAM
ncbi:MAG: arginine--tRNA ligase [Defluviitaleaceae bacterium]|nr:arginine--tRNA ligase [Defluviitaleaceae bacterium]